MNPGQMNFDPGGWFYYGGSYLYPLGFLVYVAKVFGLCHITNDISYYVGHSHYISTMYAAGRGLNVVALLGILFLLGRLWRQDGRPLVRNHSDAHFRMLPFGPEPKPAQQTARLCSFLGPSEPLLHHSLS